MITVELVRVAGEPFTAIPLYQGTAANGEQIATGVDLSTTSSTRTWPGTGSASMTVQQLRFRQRTGLLRKLRYTRGTLKEIKILANSEVKSALTALLKAMDGLASVATQEDWLELTQSYPFAISFDELTEAVREWIKSVSSN